MLRLILPCREYLSSYAEACDEYERLGITDYRFTDPRCTDVLQKFEDYRLERHLKPNRVGSHYYWLVDDESQRFIGEITIRHRLNAALERIGGHIGYGIRASEQGKGIWRWKRQMIWALNKCSSPATIRTSPLPASWRKTAVCSGIKSKISSTKSAF